MQSSNLIEIVVYILLSIPQKYICIIDIPRKRPYGTGSTGVGALSPKQL